MTHEILTLFRSLVSDLSESALPLLRKTDSHSTFILDMGRDVEAVSQRLEAEGPSFFTMGLPLLNKHILACIEGGAFLPFPGLKTRKRSVLPCFMHGWFGEVFCDITGAVHPHVNPYFVYAIRQLLLFANKAKVLPTDKKCRKAFRTFKEDDNAIDQESLWSTSISTFGYSGTTRDHDFTVDLRWTSLTDPIGRMFFQAGRAIGRTVEDNLPDGSFSEIRPKHGPGSVAERLDVDDKWRHIVSHESRRLDDFFPTHLVSSAFYRTAFEHEEYSPDNALNRGHSPSRLLAVPKTAATPRLIASEPCANQFWQQGLMDAISCSIRNSWIRTSVDIEDQSRSKMRARSGSIDRALSTIDLSKASDTVTLDHMAAIFPPGSRLCESILASRTDCIDIPGFGSHRLRKLATMGSAVCFPMESLVFLAAVAASVLKQSNKPATNRNVRSVCRTLTVYGDDIIVESRYFQGVLKDLTTLGFLPNVDKSFSDSYFRESCGGDYYQGTPVRPVYFRQDVWSRETLTDEDVVSLVATSRQLVDNGLYQTARVVLDWVESRLKTSLPFTVEVKPYLSHNHPERCMLEPLKTRWNSDLQVLELKGWASKPNLKATTLDGYDRLIRNLVERERMETHSDILEWDPGTVANRGSSLKLRWIAV